MLFTGNPLAAAWVAQAIPLSLVLLALFQGDGIVDVAEGQPV